MALKAIESNVLTLISGETRRFLDNLSDLNDIVGMYDNLVMDTTLTNADIEAAGFHFNKAALTDVLDVFRTLQTTVSATEKSKMYKVASNKTLR
jgi:hypothetical protein